MQGGLLLHPPLSTRSSIGVDSAGALHVDRVKFFGTWRGDWPAPPPSAGSTTRRRGGQVMLFTPAFGARDAGSFPGAAEIVLQPFSVDGAEHRSPPRR